MKNKLLLSVTALSLLCFPNVNFGQVVTLGTAANFVLFSSDGAVTNNTSSFSQITGDIGTGNPATTSTGFGNVNGNHHDGDAVGLKAASDLLLASEQIRTMTVGNLAHAPLLGNGETLTPGVYDISSAATVNLNLILDGNNDPNAVFIFKIQGTFSTGAGAKIKLIKGALACNVFWRVVGKVDLATGTTMRGTVIAVNSEIVLTPLDTLEGRALSTTGAITINGIFAYTPLGCSTPVLTGPTAPTLGAAACFALFSTTGAVSNSGVTKITGDIGSNSTTAPTGFVASDVTGKIHLTKNGATQACADDLALAYAYLNTLPVDIELKFPAQFGNHLVLTPHTYLLNAATHLTDTVVLNAQGNVNAVFVIKLNGALSTSVGCKVKMINGAQSKNVYWKIEGAVGINDNSKFVGTIVVNNGALGSLNTGVKLDGRALTTNGALTTTALNVVATMLPGNCATVGISSIDAVNTEVTIFPNPFSTSATIILNNLSQINNCELKMYNVLGSEVMNMSITEKTTTLRTNDLPTGIYFYKVIGDNRTIQSGKLISQQ